jgi:hypothetical protein
MSNIIALLGSHGNLIAAINRRAAMPLSKKGMKIKRSMMAQYGKRKGARVFFASAKAGVIRGVKRKARR